ncbi:MAG: S4 domain-containing protein [Sulfurovum sp.]|nr:S4 domain-containing protein [Sulfurovum sp.]
MAKQLDVSRNQVEKLIRDGLVLVNDKKILKTSFKIERG